MTMAIIPAIEMQKLFARTEELWNSATEPAVNANLELRDLFQRTRELAIEQMRENEHLRVQNLLLERQKMEAEQRLDHSRLGKENEQLKAELELINVRLAEMERETKKFRRRYEDIEEYSTNLSNIYVASTQLHATLDFSEVVVKAQEILWNLVAAPVFAIFLLNEKDGSLVLVGGEGVEGRFPGNSIAQPVGVMAEVIADGASLFVDNETTGDPLACIPLKVEDRGVVGIINVYEVEEHKGGISDLDKELFDMLASQMATAMASSRVYTETLKKLKSMESFVNLIKPV